MVYPEYDFYLQGADIRIVHAHNLYLNYAAEIGIAGALSFLWFFFGSMVTALRQKFLPPVPAPREPSPFDLEKEHAADAELQKVQDSVETAAVKPAVPIWKDFQSWEDYRLLGGMALGIGLAILSVALNGFTDDLLFNIPSSMFLWMMAALAAALAGMNKHDREGEAESREATE
jgi:putative inorganic carbon (HCO3(-)) transporter